MTTKTRLIENSDEIVAALDEAEKAGQRLYHDYDQLMEAYPNQWVAVSKDGLVAHHHELQGIISHIEAAGFSSHQVTVEYLDTAPLPLAL